MDAYEKQFLTYDWAFLEKNPYPGGMPKFEKKNMDSQGVNAKKCKIFGNSRGHGKIDYKSMGKLQKIDLLNLGVQFFFGNAHFYIKKLKHY